MKTLINYLGSRLEPVDVLYIVESMARDGEIAQGNLVIQLAKAGIRSTPISRRTLRLKNGSRILFYDAGAALTGIRVNFAVIDGFISNEYVDNAVRCRLDRGCEDNLIFLGGGMSQIREFARKNAYERFR